MAGRGFVTIESAPLRFGKDGRWYAGHEPITHRRIAALFSRNLRRDEDGRWWVELGDERAPVEVEDTPFVVTRVDAAPGAGFRIELNDGASEPLAPERLFLSGDVLYAEVKNGSAQARFLRAPQAELLARVEERDGQWGLPGPDGRLRPIPTRERRGTGPCESS